MGLRVPFERTLSREVAKFICSQVARKNIGIRTPLPVGKNADATNLEIQGYLWELMAIRVFYLT